MFIEKKKWAAGLLLALSVVCLASGCSLQKEAASDELWGRADAKETDINSKVAGRVVQLRVKEGDTVKQGDIIAYIDQRDLLAQKAQAGLLQTDANLAATDAAQKKLEAAQAQLQQIEVSLDETEIKAPFDGIITAKYIEEGSMISLGTPLVALQDPNDNWVDFKIPETKLKDFHFGQVLTMQARDGVTRVQGTITDISQKSEFATQRGTSERGNDTDIISFNVKVQVNSDALRPGMRFQYMAGD